MTFNHKNNMSQGMRVLVSFIIKGRKLRHISNYPLKMNESKEGMKKGN